MLVDDSAVIRGLLTRSLETDPQVRVMCSAANGVMALRALERNDVEVVVLDIEMPEMDGLTALPLMLKVDPALKVIMASTLTRKNAEVSMRALDLSEKNRELTRLDAVKHVFEQFVLGGGGLAGRDDDAIGLVAFARYADTRSPLTLDHGNLATAARQLEFAPQAEDGTAIGAGLELAVQRLAEFKARSKIIILLTDGESNVHDIDEDTAIEDAVKAGIKVYTIGAGTNGVAPIRIDRGDGASELRQMQVSIDETTLRKIADKTGGQYFRATDNASLGKIYAQIDKLERTQLEEERFTRYREYYGMFTVIAMALVFLAFVLRGTVFRRLP